MKILTLTFALLMSLNTIAKADDVIGTVFEDRKDGTQLLLECIDYDQNRDCNQMQYSLKKGSKKKVIGPVLGDEIFDFTNDNILKHLDEEKLKELNERGYVEMPNFFPNGAFPANNWYLDNDLYAAAAVLTIGGGFVSCFVLAAASAGPIGWSVLGGVVVLAFVGPTVIDFVVMSAKGVAIGATSVAVGSANLTIAIKNGINKLKTEKVFNKLGKAMNANPDIDRISHRKFNRIVNSIKALNI